MTCNCNNEYIKRVIGVTRTFNWTITTGGEDVSLEGRNLTLQLMEPRGSVVDLPFSTTGDVVSFTWQGDDQTKIGLYSLILWENYGEDSQRRVDIHNFVELIPWSDNEQGTYSDLAEETITLETSDFGADVIVEDNLTSTSTSNALSANMGRALNITKQDVIADLATIRSGAAAGAAVKEWAKNDVVITDDGTQATASKLSFNGNIFEQWISGVASSITLKGIAGFLKLADISQWGSAYNDRMLPTVAAVKSKIDAVANALATIEAVIPSQASSSNKLTDKAYVDGAIATNTANFVGTFDTLAELQAVQNPTKNDYGFVIEQDAQGNEYYDRYKYTGSQWLFEYKVESTPFTTEQWAAIQSGITAALVSKLSALPTNAELNTALAGKQPVINDLPTIRSGAAAGATAYQKPAAGIPKTDLASAVQTSLDKVIPIEANLSYVSDNNAVNGFFKELYLIGINYANVASIAVSGSQTGLTCTFKDSGNNILASLASNAPLGNEFISRDVNGAIMIASVDWNGLTEIKKVVNSCTLTEKVGNLIKNPALVGFLSRRTASNTIPTYTKNSGYRINSSGSVVSSGSSHFYTSPIAVKGGDCILLTSKGASGGAMISLTDANGTFYTPIAIYTGTDPDTYFYRVKENGFVAITGYTAADFRLTIFRESEIAAIYDKFKEDEDVVISEIKSIPVDFRKRDSSVYVGADIDADWETVDGATKANTIQYNNITRRKVRCATFVGPSNNGIARIRFSKSVNANLHPFLFSICIGDYSDIVNAPAGDIKLIFYSGSQAFNSSRSMKIPLQTATSSQDYNTVFNRNGWFSICAFLPSYEVESSEIGSSFDPTNVTGFGVHLINTRSLPVTLHVERMDFLDAVMTKPGVVTIVDNFNPQVPTMADYAHSKGVRLNLSIIPGYYAGASGAPTCASEEELTRLALQGHFIWNHTWTHPNFNDISVPQIHDQINLAERWMQLNGYGEGKRIVSIPSARFNTRSCNAALDTNVEMFFHSWVRQKKQVFIPFAPVNRLLPTTWLDSDALGAGESGADIATAALKCLTYNGLTVIGFHGTYLTNEGGGLDEWKAYIDAIAASNAYHYGLDEILEGGWN